MPLAIAPENKEVRILKILTDDKTKKHLESLGVSVNSTLTILDGSNGNVILLVKEGRLALDKSLAMKIVVI